MKFTFGIWLTNHSWRKGSLWKIAQTPSNGNDTANVRNVLIKWNRNSRQNERDLILIWRITRAGSFVINWKRMHRNPNEKVFIFLGSTLFISVDCFKWKKKRKLWWEQKVSFHNFSCRTESNGQYERTNEQRMIRHEFCEACVSWYWWWFRFFQVRVRLLNRFSLNWIDFNTFEILKIESHCEKCPHYDAILPLTVWCIVCTVHDINKVT